MTKIEARHVPDDVRRLGALPGHQYADLFVADDIAGECDAERWAHAVLSTRSARLFAQPVWRVAVGLRLASLDAPGAIQGWPISGHGPGWVRVEASSWLLTAHVLFRAVGAERSVSLFVRFERRAGALVWLPVAVVHRRALPALMQEALKHHPAAAAPDP